MLESRKGNSLSQDSSLLPVKRRNFRIRNKATAEKAKHLETEKDGWGHNSITLRSFKKSKENKGEEPWLQSRHFSEMAPNSVKSRRVPPSDLDVPCRHNTCTVTVEDVDHEEEVDVNAAKR